MKQILSRAILLSEELAPMYGRQTVQSSNYLFPTPPITSLQNSHTLSSTQTRTHTHTCNSQFFPPHISEKFSLSVFLSVCPVSHTHTQKNKNTDCCEQNFKPKFYNQFRCNANKINFSKFQFKFGLWCIKIYSNILTKF